MHLLLRLCALMIGIGLAGSALAQNQPPREPPPPPLIGCFKDTSALDLDGYIERSAQNTPFHCVTLCYEKGFRYAAVQNGESCLCGNSYGKYGPADNCNMGCPGGSMTCGGSSANAVYRTGR